MTTNKESLAANLHLVASARDLSLDVLRAVAILLVLSAHYFSHHIPIGGLLGVELFFSLSGFLIGRILLRELVLTKSDPTYGNVASFWRRRWFRTLPNYYVYFLVYLIVAHGARLIDGERVFLYLPFLQNWAWPIGDFFGVSWSLAVEEWFYLVFPTVVLLLRWLSRDAQYSFWVTVAIFIACPLFVRCAYITNHGAGGWDEHIRKVVIYRLDATMFGVVIAGISLTQAPLWRALQGWVFLLIGALLVGVGCLLVRQDSIAVGIAFTVLPLGWALWIAPLQRLCAGSTPGKRWRFTMNAVITWVSILSYSLYLCHMLVFDVVAVLLNDSEATVTQKVLNRFIMIALTFALAAVSYRWIERPMLDLRDQRVNRGMPDGDSV